MNQDNALALLREGKIPCVWISAYTPAPADLSSFLWNGYRRLTLGSLPLVPPRSPTWFSEGPMRKAALRWGWKTLPFHPVYLEESELPEFLEWCRSLSLPAPEEILLASIPWQDWTQRQVTLVQQGMKLRPWMIGSLILLALLLLLGGIPFFAWIGDLGPLAFVGFLLVLGIVLYVRTKSNPPKA